MISDCPLPLQARKTILKEVGPALKDMHTRNWTHLDTKPDNVFIDWFVNMGTKFCLEKVQLGDLDCASQLIGTHLLSHKIGNVMWQSPEGRLRRGMGKHSEVLSFRLLASQINPHRVPISNNMALFNVFFLSVELAQVILHEVLSNFGPLPDELVKHVDDEEAVEPLKDLWKMIEEDEERVEGPRKEGGNG
ncbi:hypothetical protein EAF00_005559 [Botryotinia globosa]|nr:hypothetical protein EAF00_005559 [Botryotinia globosa]